MKHRHHDIVIPPEDPFANCKLNRKPYAEVLTNIVNTSTEGFVMSINNEWGTGKTTFIKMWQRMLEKEGHKTIYFNAWESDFQNEPLAALLGEFRALINKKGDKRFKSLIEKGAILSKSVLPGLIKAIAAKYIDVDAVNNAIEGITKGAAEILRHEIEEYISKKEGLEDFKKELQAFIESVAANKPLIFIIDELDRCRPSYAVEVLEQVKHLFSVKGIVFVLSLDKQQLAHAVRGVYGSEKIEAEEYLRRFIDIEYSIPLPNTELFVKYLFEYFDFDSFLQATRRADAPELRNDREDIINFSCHLFKSVSATLRHQERIFSHARLALLGYKHNEYLFPFIFLFLIFLRNFHTNIYMKIRRLELTPQELIDEIETLFIKGIGNVEAPYFISMEAALLVYYHNSYKELHPESQILKDDGDGNLVSTVHTQLDSIDKFYNIGESMNNVIRRHRVGSVKIDLICNGIDLLKEFSGTNK